jgi:TrmH family RNA methyltransferase
MKRITSAENPQYRALLKLAQSSRERRKAGLSLLDGVHLVDAFREQRGKPVEVAVSEAALANAEIQSLLATLRPLEPLLLSDALFATLSTVSTPTGIVASVKTPRMVALPSRLDTCVMLEDIQDPGNLGSILRSAAAAGCDAVFLSQGCADAWSPKVLRAGMGGHFSLSITESANLLEVAAAFTGKLLAASLQADKSLYDSNLRGKLAFAIGNEGAGLSPALLEAAQQHFIIPMPGKIESLNAAAATAVCLFEAVRQRQ